MNFSKNARKKEARNLTGLNNKVSSLLDILSAYILRDMSFVVVVRVQPAILY